MDPQIIDANTLPWDKLDTGLSKTLLGQEFSKNAQIRLFCLKPKEIFESHEHEFLQFMYFTSGEGTVSVDDKVEKIRPGLTAIVLPKQCHSVENSGNDDLEIVVVELFDITMQDTPFVDF